MKRQIKLWGSRAIILALLFFAGRNWGMPLYKQYFTPKKTTAFVPTTKVQAGKFVVSFHEIGTLEAEKSVLVMSEVPGKIIKLVEDGTTVKAGAQIAVLDTTDLLKEVRNARLAHENSLADVSRAESELEMLKKSNETEIKQAEAQSAFDDAELEQATQQRSKKERLAKEKLVPGDQVDQAILNERAKKLAVEKGKMALDLKKKECETKQKQKEADVAKVKFAEMISKSNMEEVQNRVKKAVVMAPSSGLVVISKDWTPEGRRKLQEGDNARPQQTICSLPDLSSMLVKVKVGESDAPRLRVGLPVLITLEAVPDKKFHGTIKEISSLATESNPWEGESAGRKNFEVQVAVKEVDSKTLKPGMTADAEFICDTLQQAIYVPLECVSEREGKTYVYLKDTTRFNRTEVKVSKHNDNFICVTKGLKGGQLVSLRDPTKPLEQQEAGSATGEAGEKKQKKETPPIPGAAGKK